MWAVLVLIQLLLVPIVRGGGHVPRPVGGIRAHHPEGLRMRREYLAQRDLMKRWHDEGGGEGNGNDTTKYLFRTDKTEEFLVTSLPEVNFDFGELYSGLIPIDTANASAGELFFFFKPKIGADTKLDEITIWLNGGPGCSSIEGFWQENGPISWQAGTAAPVENPYTWANLTNMLWVEQPIGTGFSTGTPYATSEEDIAGPFLQWFKNWQDTFDVKNYKIYVTGESYAGRYVPYIAGAMVDAADKEYYNISGILVYDPCIGEYNTIQSEIPAYPFVEANRNLFGFNDTFMGELEQIHKECGYEEWLQKYLVFPPSGQQPPTFFNFTANASCDIFDLVFVEAFNLNPCFNPYEINEHCPIPYDTLGMPGSFNYVPEGFQIYFRRDDVKQAIHAPESVSNWSLCSVDPVFIGDGGPQGSGDLSPDPIQGVLPKVIENTNRVLVANGDYDYIILTNGTLLSIQNMTWSGQMGFQTQPSAPFMVNESDIQWTKVFEDSSLGGLNGPQGTMGIYHYERGLMWVQTYMSGHMVPQYQPRVAYLQLQWLLGHIDSF